MYKHNKHVINRRLHLIFCQKIPTYLQGLVVNSAKGTACVNSSISNLLIGGLGKIFPGPGSWGPGIIINLLFSKRGGNNLMILASSRSPFLSLEACEAPWGCDRKFPQRMKTVGGISEYPLNSVFSFCITYILII